MRGFKRKRKNINYKAWLRLSIVIVVIIYFFYVILNPKILKDECLTIKVVDGKEVEQKCDCVFYVWY